MFKLFGSRKTQENDAAQESAAAVETAATPVAQDAAPKPAVAPQHAPAPLTRQDAAQIRAKAEQRKMALEQRAREMEGRAKTPQAMVQKAKKRRLRFNETSHLYANHAIPLWVFHKALPQRFAQMATARASGDEFVFQ